MTSSYVFWVAVIAALSMSSAVGGWVKDPDSGSDLLALLAGLIALAVLGVRALNE